MKKKSVKVGGTQIDPNLALCLNIFQFLKDLTLPLPFFKILQRRHFLCIVTLNLSLSSICLSLFQDLPISITSAIHAIHAMHAIHGSRFQWSTHLISSFNPVDLVDLCVTFLVNHYTFVDRDTNNLCRDPWTVKWPNESKVSHWLMSWVAILPSWIAIYFFVDLPVLVIA